ncbi:MAG: VanZ family protein [Candidatus Solibacter sp.]
MFRLLLIVLAFIVYGSLYPFRFHGAPHGASPLAILLHSWPARVDRFVWRDACVNVLLYFPLGLSATLAAARYLPRLAAAIGAVVLGVALSASIEMLQLFDTSRTCSLLDVACNFSGALAGALAALAFDRQIRRIGQHQRSHHGAGGGLLLACCWAGYQLYPFIPHLGRGYLRQTVARLVATPISPVEIYASAAEWFAFALVLRALTGRPRAIWLALAMLCLPLRLVIMERGLAPAEIIGAILAMIVWTYPAVGTRLRGGAIALAIAVVLRELTPFDFSGPAHAMSWLPFSATLDGERLNAALILLRKSFDYGALVWLLRGAGIAYARGGALTAAGLLALEVAQRYMPGRQPEFTDSMIALILAAVFWGLETSRRRAQAAGPR